MRPLTYYTVSVFFVVSSTVLVLFGQLYHVECQVDLKFGTMHMFKGLLQNLPEET